MASTIWRLLNIEEVEHTDLLDPVELSVWLRESATKDITVYMI